MTKKLVYLFVACCATVTTYAQTGAGIEFNGFSKSITAIYGGEIIFDPKDRGFSIGPYIEHTIGLFNFSFRADYTKLDLRVDTQTNASYYGNDTNTFIATDLDFHAINTLMGFNAKAGCAVLKLNAKKKGTRLMDFILEFGITTQIPLAQRVLKDTAISQYEYSTYNMGMLPTPTGHNMEYGTASSKMTINDKIKIFTCFSPRIRFYLPDSFTLDAFAGVNFIRGQFVAAGKQTHDANDYYAGIKIGKTFSFKNKKAVLEEN